MYSKRRETGIGGLFLREVGFCFRQFRAIGARRTNRG
jgi:hypothetical protein